MAQPEIVIVPAIFGITGTVILMFRWFRHREHMATVARPERATAIEERMERIERAVEAIAVEVERVGEGQRFVTKLLAEGGRTPEERRNG
jgi:hypothetical protein